MKENTMKVTVKHMERDEMTGDVIGFTPVAEVNASYYSNNIAHISHVSDRHL